MNTNDFAKNVLRAIKDSYTKMRLAPVQAAKRP